MATDSPDRNTGDTRERGEVRFDHRSAATGMLAALAVAALQSGCAGSISNLLGNRNEGPDQKPATRPVVSRTIPANSHSVIQAPEEDPKEAILRKMAELKAAELNCDNIFTSSMLEIDAADFKKIDRLAQRIKAEVDEFRANPTEIQKDSLQLSYYELQLALHFTTTTEQLGDIAAGYIAIIGEYTRLLQNPLAKPYSRQIADHIEHMKGNIKRMEQVSMNVVVKLRATQLSTVPHWKEIDKIPVRDILDDLGPVPNIDDIVPKIYQQKN